MDVGDWGETATMGAGVSCILDQVVPMALAAAISPLISLLS
jgi:hypothetical protein